MSNDTLEETKANPSKMNRIYNELITDFHLENEEDKKIFYTMTAQSLAIMLPEDSDGVKNFLRTMLFDVQLTQLLSNYNKDLTDVAFSYIMTAAQFGIEMIDPDGKPITFTMTIFDPEVSASVVSGNKDMLEKCLDVILDKHSKYLSGFIGVASSSSASLQYSMTNEDESELGEEPIPDDNEEAEKGKDNE